MFGYHLSKYLRILIKGMQLRGSGTFNLRVSAASKTSTSDIQNDITIVFLRNRGQHADVIKR